MSENNSTGRVGGIGVLGLLQVFFITMKAAGITKIATWSWAAVFIPAWIGLGIFVIFILILVISIIISSK